MCVELTIQITKLSLRYEEIKTGVRIQFAKNANCINDLRNKRPTTKSTINQMSKVNKKSGQLILGHSVPGQRNRLS